MTRLETASVPGEAGRRHRFDRPLWKVGFDLIAAPLGALLFGGLALAILLGMMQVPASDRLQIGALIGFFAVMLAVASVVTFRRGLRRTVLEVGPDGIWTPEMGQLSWSDVGEIRLESYLSPSGRSRGGPRMVRRQRLGIVPREGVKVHGSKAASTAQSLVRGYYRFLESRGFGLKTGVDQLAPHGVEAYELAVPLEVVAAAVSQFHEVRDARVERVPVGS